MTGPAAAVAVDPAGRWPQLAILAGGLLLAMAPWFSSSAVAPALVDEWGASGLDLPLLAVAVQLGFALGALGLAVAGAPDVIPGPRLIAAGAVLAAVANLGFALVATDVLSALPFRALTGAALGAVYPVALKMASGWFRVGRGLAIGILIAALTVGSALPYLFRAAGAYAGLDWRPVVVAASVAAVLGGVVVLFGARAGRSTSPPRASHRPSPPPPSASQPSDSPTWATWGTCGSCTRCGPGSRCSWSGRSRSPD